MFKIQQLLLLLLSRRVFGCTELELALRTRGSIKNQQTG